MNSTINETHTSSACCRTPVPLTSTTYSPKGTYTTLASAKTYLVGPSNATRAIVYIYDVFGFLPPTLMGADRLAALTGNIVIMPDLFDGQEAKVSWLFLPDGERQRAISPWMAKHVADARPALARIANVVHEAKMQFPSVEKWGCIGFCWGGKLVSLSSAGPDTLWSVGVQSSPARVDAADAAKISIPQMVLASKDEPKDDIAAYDAALQVPKHVETFDDQIHGWMSARTNLEDARVRAEFERGFKLAADWFGKYMRGDGKL